MENLNIDIKIFSEYIISFINETNSFNAESKKVSPLKLQKMLYFLYAYALTKWDKKLWENKFENWNLEPVIPEVYYEYAKYGNKPIKLNNNFISLPMLTNFEKVQLQSLTLELNNFTASELSKKSHCFPWENINQNEEIKDQDIIDYYSKPDTFINKLIDETSLEINIKFLF